MAAKEQEKPLAPSAGHTPRGSHRDIGDSSFSGGESNSYLRHRRCILWSGCCALTLVVLTILIVILALTVFHVKDPTLTISDVTIQGLEMSSSGLLRTNVNVTLGAGVAVKNPNAASLKFSNFTTEIYYDGIVVGEASVPAGNARARRTMKMNVTAVVMTEKLAQAPSLVGDLADGELEVAAYMVVKGRVKLLGFVKKHVAVAMNCSLNVDIKSQDVELQHCSRHVSL